MWDDLALFTILWSGKYLGTLGVQRNGAPSSHIHGGFHHEFNEQTSPWMWEEGAPYSVLR